MMRHLLFVFALNSVSLCIFEPDVSCECMCVRVVWPIDVCVMLSVTFRVMYIPVFIANRFVKRIVSDYKGLLVLKLPNFEGLGFA